MIPGIIVEFSKILLLVGIFIKAGDILKEMKKNKINDDLE